MNYKQLLYCIASNIINDQVRAICVNIQISVRISLKEPPYLNFYDTKKSFYYQNRSKRDDATIEHLSI